MSEHGEGDPPSLDYDRQSHRAYPRHHHHGDKSSHYGNQYDYYHYYKDYRRYAEWYWQQSSLYGDEGYMFDTWLVHDVHMTDT
jgi:hypothetical protein